jgi:hypothetical protein
VPIVVLDLGTTWIADFLFPLSDKQYWEAFFCLSSFKILLISFLCRLAYEFYIFRPLKTPISLWLVNSWLGFCVSDFIDVMNSQRSDFTIFDGIAVVFCIISFIKSCYVNMSSNNSDS